MEERTCARHRRKVRQMEGLTNGRTVGWKDGQMEGRKDEGRTYGKMTRKKRRSLPSRPPTDVPKGGGWWRKRESTEKPALETLLTQALAHWPDNAQRQTKNNIARS